MNFQTMNKQRKFILLAAATGIISVFLPWVSFSILSISESINGFHGTGVFVFLCFVGIAVAAYTGNQVKPLEKDKWFLSVACGSISLLLIVFSLASSLGNGFVEISIGFGLWIAMAAMAVIVIVAWKFKDPAYNLKEGFNKLKKTISPGPIDKNIISTDIDGSNKIIMHENVGRIKDKETIK